MREEGGSLREGAGCEGSQPELQLLVPRFALVLSKAVCQSVADARAPPSCGLWNVSVDKLGGM